MTLRSLPRVRPGITLAEITLTVTIIFVVSAAVFAAVDPLRRLAQTRNASRMQDINAIATAASLRIVRNEPLAVDTNPATWQMLGIALFGCDMECAGVTTESACLNLPDILGAGYLPEMPFDPDSDESTGVTGYAINRVGGSVSVRACLAEGEGPRGGGEPPLLDIAR